MGQIVPMTAVSGLTGMRRFWAYNGLDCCITREIRDVLAPRLDQYTGPTYAFERAVQAPALTMSLRGIAVDETARSKALVELTKEEAQQIKAVAAIIAPYWDYKKKLPGFCPKGETEKSRHKWPKDVPDEHVKCEVCGSPRLIAADFNPHSSKQLLELLYKKLGMVQQRDRKTGKPTAGKEALEKLRTKYPYHTPILDAITEAHRARKQIGLLKSKPGRDGRLHSSFNVGATETFRWSSSKDAFGNGLNIQQVADRSRNVFVADPGMVLFYADLEQAESNCVAHDAQDEAYINAHKSGDVHTTVAKMLWPGLPWTGDLKLDKKVAETKTDFDPHHSYRDYSKHVQHGSNIGMTPFGIARDAHIKLEDAKRMQGNYFDVFSGVRRRQQELARMVHETGQIITPMGDKRQFFGRIWDDATIREALSFTQQSMIARILNLALWRVWHELDTCLNMNGPHINDPNKAWCLAQVHDAILGEVRKGDDATLARIKELMTIPVPIHSRIMTVAVEIAIGPNWQKGALTKWLRKG